MDKCCQVNGREVCHGTAAVVPTTEVPGLPEGVPPLVFLYLYISGACNLRCRHCWMAPTFQIEKKSGRHMPMAHVKKAVRQARPMGLQTVKLTGGEPMMHPMFGDVVRFIDGEGLEIHIETNGTLVDGTSAKLLRRSDGVTAISVSVDGADPETHDGLRGVHGSFHKAVDGIKHLVAEGIRPQLICTLHKGNATQVSRIVDLAESLGCGSVKFNHILRMGRGERLAKDMGLGVSQIISLYRHVEKDLNPGRWIPIHFDIPHAFYPIRKLLDDGLSRCTVDNILGVLAGGELSLCGVGVSEPALNYGHVATDRLAEVWAYSPGLVQLRKQVPGELEGICSVCLHRNVCKAYCVAGNYYTTGKLNAPNSFCMTADALGLFPASRKKRRVNQIAGDRSEVNDGRGQG
jgi:SynChlorMet cassette radical SAM/SPASM protein ScmF